MVARLIFSNTSNKFLELDPDTMVNISGAGWANTGANRMDCGWVGERFYSTNRGTKLWYEHETSTFTVLNSAGYPSANTNGGGMGGMLEGDGYATNYGTDKMYKFDTDTLANLSGAGVSTPAGGAKGCGGVRDRVYSADIDVDKLYEHDTDTLANLSGAGVSAPALNPQIGGLFDGTDNTLYVTATDKIYKVDVDTLANLSGAGVTATGGTGIGGSKISGNGLSISALRRQFLISGVRGRR